MTFLFFAGCASVSYVPYTQEVYPPKSKDSPLILEPSLLAKRKFTKIGQLAVKGGSWGSHYTSMRDVEKKFFSESLKKGADGIVKIEINNVPYEYDRYVPGHTSYQPVTTHHSGNVSGTMSSRAYSSYGSSAWGTGSYSGYYSGTSTTNVPVYHPGYTIHHSGIIHSISGDLIVLLDKDTFGCIGVFLDMGAQNVNGARIWRVEEGSPAQQGGLEAGDILTKVDGIELKNAMDFFTKVQLKVGEPIEATYLRAEKELTTQLTPQKGYIVESSRKPKVQFDDLVEAQSVGEVVEPQLSLDEMATTPKKAPIQSKKQGGMFSDLVDSNSSTEPNN